MENLPVREKIPPFSPSAGAFEGARCDAKALDSHTLFAGGNEIVITHGAEVYRLRLTRQNRLILTK